MRTTEEQRRATEKRIRAAMDRLLRGDLPPGGKVDVKTLAAEADISRNTLYTTYHELKVEFEQRRDRLREAGQILDPRDEQIARLKTQVAELQRRVGARQADLEELRAFKSLAVSQIAAQYMEINRLRRRLANRAGVAELHPAPSSPNPQRPSHQAGPSPSPTA
ncbi:hypothetical protein ACGFJT_42005 [Actinomadura geliboluensis]|uniref:hypothetical protein n=1 Tax=Actinomadura geliboluensis TaxID=882440 RepID=UPI003723F592